jgi:hypothetical protein
MISATLATPSRPRVLQPGLAALETGTERYGVEGGGSMTFSVEAGDQIRRQNSPSPG